MHPPPTHPFIKRRKRAHVAVLPRVYVNDRLRSGHAPNLNVNSYILWETGAADHTAGMTILAGKGGRMCIVVPLYPCGITPPGVWVTLKRSGTFVMGHDQAVSTASVSTWPVTRLTRTYKALHVARHVRIMISAFACVNDESIMI